MNSLHSPFKIHINTLLPFTPRSSKWSLPFRFSSLVNLPVNTSFHCKQKLMRGIWSPLCSWNVGFRFMNHQPVSIRASDSVPREHKAVHLCLHFSPWPQHLIRIIHQFGLSSHTTLCPYVWCLQTLRTCWWLCQHMGILSSRLYQTGRDMKH